MAETQPTQNTGAHNTAPRTRDAKAQVRDGAIAAPTLVGTFPPRRPISLWDLDVTDEVAATVLAELRL